jgi:hypothetical protein
MGDKESMFKPGEFEAARLFVACLGQHANGHTFKTDSIGFEFFDIAELPAAVSDDGTIVTTKDFIRAALQIVYGQLQTLELIVYD